MMVPQSYRHATWTPPSDFSINDRKSTIRSSVPKDIPRTSDDSVGRPKMLSSISSPTPSKPVIIPTKSQTPKSHRSRSGNTSSKPAASPPHDPKALPPSMAALLAVASSQNPPGFTLRRDLSGRNIKKENLSLDDFRYTLSSSSPKSWSILQGPPDDVGENKDSEGDAWSVASGSTVAPLSSYRSLSTDSMPSLDESDLESPRSFSPLTPSSHVRKQIRREKRQPQKLPVSGSDDPLSPPPRPKAAAPTFIAEETPETLPATLIPTTTTRTTRSSFKSNLTASIRLLRSAAHSLSDIAPKHYALDPIPRPTPCSATRSAQLPQTQPLDLAFAPTLPNIDALSFHLHLSSLPSLPPSTASIQLMPYIPSPISGSALATAPPVFLPAANPVLEELERKRSSPRPREPRENGSFLRVVVLEMNMRRGGKLKGDGKARIWLGARAEGGDDRAADISDVTAGADKVVDGELLEEGHEVNVEDKGEFARSGGDAKTVQTRDSIGQNRYRRRRVPPRWVGVAP